MPFLAAALALVLAACVLPIPHTEARSPEVHGRVIDAASQAPIAGAKVIFTALPSLAAITDANGEFLIKKMTSFLLLAPMGPCPPNITVGKFYYPYLHVTREGYTPTDFTDGAAGNYDVIKMGKL